MTPTETLRNEHCNILRVLACLEIAAQRIRAGEAVDVADLRDMARFCKEYADGSHHAKEEEHLFPALADHGVPVDGGPLAIMLAEHDEGRALVREMRASVEGPSPDEDALKSFAANAAQFVLLLRDHIGKEDHVLFRMAEDVLPPDVMDRMEDVFAKVVALEIGQDVHDALEALATHLGEKYGVPEQSNADNLPGCVGS